MHKSLLFILLSLVLSSCQSLFTPTLKVGVSSKTNSSYTYVDEGGNYQGSDIDLAKNFAQSLGMNIKFVSIDLKQEADIILNGFVKHQGLNKDYLVSHPYQNRITQAFILRKNARSLKSKNSGFFLDQKHITWGILNFSNNLAFAQEQISNELKFYNSVEDGFQALRRREITTFITDPTLIQNYISENPFSDITSFQWTPKKEEIVALFPKDSPYLVAFNEFISKQK